MTVAELIAKLQECNPTAVVAAPADLGPALLEDADVAIGWWCPALLSDGRDDFWGETERCATPEGVYQPRPQDVRAVYLRIGG
jgi:hypothetical protein